MKITPRDYQKDCIKVGLDYINGTSKKRSLIVAPTAAGKSIIIGGIASELNTPSIVLQPSIELLHQNYNKLINFGGEATIFSASAGIKEISNLTYVTLGSIKNMAKDFKAIGVKTLIIDEAHFNVDPKPGSMFRNFVDELKPKSVLGLTATPFRLKQYGGKGNNWSQLDMLCKNSKSYFKDILKVVQIQEMTSREYWSKLNYEAYDFDESTLKLNTSGAEFTEKSISQYISECGINNNIYLRLKQLLKEGKRKSILVFCDSVETCKILESRFENSATVCHTTPKKERERIVNAFKSQEIKIVFNYSALGIGFDHEALDCIIMGRPTNSLALYYQFGGRGTRKHPQKEDCLVIDYGGNLKRFGRLEDLVFENIEGYGWTLFNGSSLDSRMMTNVPIGSNFTKRDLLNQLKVEERDKIDMTLSFGKYKGKKVSQLPLGYVKWMLDGDFEFRGVKGTELKRQLKIRLLN